MTTGNAIVVQEELRSKRPKLKHKQDKNRGKQLKLIFSEFIHVLLETDDIEADMHSIVVCNTITTEDAK